MVASSQYATTVMTEVLISRVDGSYAIVSEQLPGLFLSGKDLSALLADVPSAIKMLYRLDCGMDVQVVPVAEEANERTNDQWANLSSKFVAIPVSAAA